MMNKSQEKSKTVDKRVVVWIKSETENELYPQEIFITADEPKTGSFFKQVFQRFRKRKYFW